MARAQEPQVSRVHNAYNTMPEAINFVAKIIHNVEGVHVTGGVKKDFRQKGLHVCPLVRHCEARGE